MTSPAELKDLVLLNRLSLTGAKSVHGLLLNGLTPGEILSQIRTENFLDKKEALLKLESEFDAQKEIELAAKNNIQLLTLLEPDYPARLACIADPPLVLYVRGALLEVDRSAVAIVGTRHPSFYGNSQASKFSRELSEKGFTIVSGLAQGIDQIAHKACLEITYGRTLAVLGCGMDVDYPSGSAKLKESIAQRGAVLTEYAFGTPPRAENFPKRNRIIAGLALGTLVIEAHSRSGSLITAHLAADEGREVFAVPGAVDQLGSRGTNHLIKEGAHLAESASDVIEVLAPLLSFQIEKKEPGIQRTPDSVPCAVPDSKEIPGPSLDAEEEKLIQLLGSEPLSGDELSERSGAGSAHLGAVLTMLELKGKIRRRQDGRFVPA